MGDLRTSSMGGVPFGTSSARPSNPSIGQTYYNGTLGVQEIYTVSGWLPATGANDFNVTLNGTVTTATFTKEYFSGAYTIASALLDSTYDIYVYGTDGSLAGYTKSPSLTATGNFNKIVVIGGTAGDLLSFSYKTTFTANSTTSEVTAGPFITSLSTTTLPNINSTTIVTGGNFASDVSVTFTGTGYSATPAKSVVRNSSSSLTVTRPDSFPVSGNPYTMTITNPSVTNQPTGSNLHIYSGISAGVVPVWITQTLPNYISGSPYSTTLSATDADGASVVSYSIVSGSLPTGLSLNSSTGAITGTSSSTTGNTIVFRATDSGGNFTNKSLDLGNTAGTTGGTVTTSGSYRIHSFTGNGTFTPTFNGNVEYLVVAGGGGGSSIIGGGGGAGGVLTGTLAVTINTAYPITVGSGGRGGTGYSDTNSMEAGYPGFNSVFSSITATGGGGTVGWDASGLPAMAGQNTWTKNGGSGGGGSGTDGNATSPSYPNRTGGTGINGQGYAGGNGSDPYGAGGGGAGGAGSQVNGSANTQSGGNGVSSSITGSAVTYGGGGGGGRRTSGAGNGPSLGGSGGGGTSMNGSTFNSNQNGTSNTGGGGGGGNYSGPSAGSQAGGNGGSGIIILRYLNNV